MELGHAYNKFYNTNIIKFDKKNKQYLLDQLKKVLNTKCHDQIC